MGDAGKVRIMCRAVEEDWCEEVYYPFRKWFSDNDNRRYYEASQNDARWFEAAFQPSRELYAQEEYAYSFADAWWD